MMTLAAAAVHTTGVNWDQVLANAVDIVVVIGAISAMLWRTFKRQVSAVVDAVVKKEVTPLFTKINARLDAHDVAIARLAGIEEGKRQAVDQASMRREGP